MEIFKNKFLVKLIATICLFLTLFNFTGISRVYAAGDDVGLGGVLIRPVVYLITAIGDGIVNILHRVVLEQNDTLLKIEGKTRLGKVLEYSWSNCCGGSCSCISWSYNLCWIRSYCW